MLQLPFDKLNAFIIFKASNFYGFCELLRYKRLSVCKILMRALPINNTLVFVLISITGN
jgi:hypothetical protein